MAFDPDAYLAKNSAAAPKAEGFDPDKYLAQGDMRIHPAASPPAEEPGLLRKGFDYAMRALDYPGGLVRTSAAGLAGLVNPNIVREGDVANAFKGKAPSSAEFLERAGVSEGPHVNLMPEMTIPFTNIKLGEGDTSLRDAEGLALDIATDPLVAVARGAKALAPAKYAKAADVAERGLLRPASEVAEGLGTKAYKSGLKKIDAVAERYGKEPVSDVLMKYGISGSSKDIFKQMSELGDRILQERNAILKQGSKAGAEVDMKRAMKEAQDVIGRLKQIDNPEMQQAVKMLEGRVGKYLDRGAKPAEQTLRELPTSTLVPEYREIKGYGAPKEELIQLPTSKLATEAKFQPEALGYDAPTLSNPGQGSERWSGRDLVQSDARGRLKKIPNEPVTNNPLDDIVSLPQSAKYETKMVPGKLETALRQDAPEIIYGREIPRSYKPGLVTVLDETERIPGPSPSQASAWKTSAAANVSDPAWQILSQSGEGKQFDKALASGLRQATEDSIRKTLGADAAKTLSAKNNELSRILTTKERALLDAEIEGRRNGLSSVDGMGLGLVISHPELAPLVAAKKAADAAKTTYVRTKGGRGLINLGKTGLLDEAIRRGLINANDARGISNKKLLQLEQQLSEGYEQ